MKPAVRFYFSFRSPYAWFAAERWWAELGDACPEVQRIPLYPTAEDFPNDPANLPEKRRYIAQDVVRLAREYQLEVRPPPALDTDWGRPHAAFLGVREQQPERAEAFMLEIFRARFSRSKDVALDPVIAEAASRAGADAELALRSAASTDLQAEAARSFGLARERDSIFGVPSFVYAGQLFWGHDRMRHLRAALDAAASGRGSAKPT